MTNDKQGTRTTKELGGSSGLQKERRRCVRFRLRGDAWFVWESIDGTRGEGGGLTRNIGRAGAFIETSQVPPVGSQLRLIVTLRGTVDDGMEARLCGVGTVSYVITHEG